jgi:G3E family GTPase
MLREPLTSLRRADMIVISRADLVTAEQRDAIADRIRQHASTTPIIEARFRVAALKLSIFASFLTIFRTANEKFMR